MKNCEALQAACKGNYLQWSTQKGQKVASKIFVQTCYFSNIAIYLIQKTTEIDSSLVCQWPSYLQTTENDYIPMTSDKEFFSLLFIRVAPGGCKSVSVIPTSRVKKALFCHHNLSVILSP